MFICIVDLDVIIINWDVFFVYGFVCEFKVVVE